MQGRKRWLLIGGVILFFGLCFVCVLLGGATALLLGQGEDMAQPSPVSTVSQPPVSTTPQPATPPSSTKSASQGTTLLLLSETGVWRVGPDEMTQVAAIPIYETFLRLERFQRPFILSPTGKHLALMIMDAGGMDLTLVDWSSGTAQKVQRLAEAQHLNEMMYVDAMASLPNLAWHPQGHLLAFVALTGDGSTSGLYVYDVTTQQVTPVDETSGFAALPRWSPDGQYLFYTSLSWAGSGGRAPNPDEATMTQLFVWNAATGERASFRLPGEDAFRPRQFLGWMDVSGLLFYQRTDGCGGPLLSISVPGGQAQPVGQFTFTSIFSLDDAFFLTSTQDCSLGTGTFLWKPGGQPQPLANGRTWDWIPLASGKGVLTYGVPSGDGILTVEGRVIPAPDATPERFFRADISSQGYQAWYDAGTKEIVIVIPEAERKAYPQLSESTALPARGSLKFLGWGVDDTANLYMVTDKGDVIVAMGPIFPDQTLGNIGRFIAGFWAP